MAEKAKHAFGSSSEVQNALNAGKIDAFDILFLDGDTEPKVGWIDRNGEFRLVENKTDLSGVEAEIAKKANAEDVATLEGQIATKVDSSEMEELEAEVAKKVDAETVQSMINEATVGVIEVVEF